MCSSQYFQISFIFFFFQETGCNSHIQFLLAFYALINVVACFQKSCQEEKKNQFRQDCLDQQKLNETTPFIKQESLHTAPCIHFPLPKQMTHSCLSIKARCCQAHGFLKEQKCNQKAQGKSVTIKKEQVNKEDKLQPRVITNHDKEIKWWTD